MKKLLIGSFVFVFILAAGVALFGEVLYDAYMTQGIRIASANGTDEPQLSGTAEEDAETVYEATKDLHTTGVPQDVDINTWRLRVEGDEIEAVEPN